ncbi:hypothetical protein [Nocardioides montaniterrae]
MSPVVVPLGVLLPASVLGSHWFGVLAAFVALNTVMYVALAIAKALPKEDPVALVPRRYRRGETRSIHPDGPA